MEILILLAVLSGLATAFFFKRGGIYNPIALETPTSPVAPSKLAEPPVEPLDFSTPQRAYHSVRAICDEMGLPLEKTVVVEDMGHFMPKDIICACIYQESQFDNRAVGKNKNSTDWGIAQVNDYWHVGKGKQFPSVEYVVLNPEICVRWMINCYLQGDLYMWSSYKTGAYKKWLSPGSKMRALKQ